MSYIIIIKEKRKRLKYYLPPIKQRTRYIKYELGYKKDLTPSTFENRIMKKQVL